MKFLTEWFKAFSWSGGCGVGQKHPKSLWICRKSRCTLWVTNILMRSWNTYSKWSFGQNGQKPLNSNRYWKCETVKFLLALMLKYKCSPLPSRSALTCKHKWKILSEDNFLKMVPRLSWFTYFKFWSKKCLSTLSIPLTMMLTTQLGPLSTWLTCIKFWLLIIIQMHLL